MMKRIISMLLALAMILPGGALAAKKNAKVNTCPLSELKEKYDGQRWQGEYETARKETVSVDVGIYFPEADKIGILEAKEHDPVQGIHVDKRSNDYDVTGEDYFYTDTGWFSIGWPEFDLRKQLDEKAKKAGEQSNYAEGIGVNYAYGTFDLDTAYAMNNDRTARSALEHVQEYLDRYFPGENVTLAPHRMSAQTEAGKYEYHYRAKKPPEKVKDYPYIIGRLEVDFDQILDGVPVVSRVPHNAGVSYGCTLGYYTDWSSYMTYHMAFVLLTKTSTVKENVSLCDPAIILQTAEDLIQKGRLRQVDSLRLGYYVKRDGKNKMKLIPAWAIEGLLFDSAKAEYKIDPEVHHCNPAEETTLIFDAQTGKLIERIQEAF